MPIQFVQLLQDSWNFMRNNTPFTLFGFLLLLALQLFSTYFSSQVEIDPQNFQQASELDKMNIISFLPMIFASIATIFVNVLLILNIKSINDGNYQHFFQHFTQSVTKFFPTLLLTIILVLPISVTMTLSFMSPASSGSMLLLPLLIFSVFVFIKLCLVTFAYLIEIPQKSISESIKFIWELSRGKMRSLFLFCLLSYILPGCINILLLNILKGEIGIMVIQFMSALISLYLIVFGFRFYQALRYTA